MGEPDLQVMRDLLTKAIEICTDADLLDLIYKLLIPMNL